MSTAPFDVAPIAARIQAAVPALRKVGRAADFGAVTKLADFIVPSAYVLLAREKPEAAKTGMAMPGQQTALAQRAPVTFGVIVAVRNYRAEAGGQLSDQLLEVLGQIRNTLLGWTPDVAGGRACQLVQGDLTDYNGATALWTDVWQTQHFLTPEIPA